MTQTLEPAARSCTSTARSRGRFAVRVGFWVVGGLVLVGGGLAAAVGTVGFDGPAPVRFVSGSEVVTLPQFGAEGSHVLLYRHDGTVTFALPLENEGAVPITVESVRLGDEPRPLLAVESVGDRPVRIGPGDTVTVTVTARYGNCRYYHERELQQYPSATVEASVLGVSVTRSIDLEHPLVVHSPMIVDCPDRTLNRDDDVRTEASP